MKKNHLSFFSFFILSALYPSKSWADLSRQCLAGVPHFSGDVVEGNPNQLPVYIEADNAILNKNDEAFYQGNVQIRQGNRYLGAQLAQVEQLTEKDQLKRDVTVSGGFDYQDNLIYLLGEKAKINLSNRSADISDGLYQLVDRQGRGDAKNIVLNDDFRLLKDATFTTCLSNDNSWSIAATEMRQYIQEEYAEMWNARFRVAGVPIFYTPYLQFPIGDRRRSGLLIPSYGSSGRDGYWFSQPFYWNIAPNMDATMTAKYMSQRGWQSINEYRLLTGLGSSTIAGEYLHNDRYSDYTGENRSRHLFYWQHDANVASDWRLHIDYTRVSDPTYFDDFDSEYGHSTAGYANQEVSLSYNQPNYDIELSALQFQLFDKNANSPYRTMPKLNFNYYRDNIGHLVDFHLFSQATQFKNDNKRLPSAWRFHVEPKFVLPLSNRYGGIKFTTKLYATRYLQKDGADFDKLTPAQQQNYAVRSQVNRTLPEFKVNLNTLLAKNFANGYTQTIEPSASYLYRPFRDQSDIGRRNTYGYDSSSDYNGLDRILSANQVTLGATTRFYDENGVERFNLGVEQIHYLTDARAETDRIKESKGTSDWNLTANYYINSQWNLAANYKYDAEYQRTSSANSFIQFRPSDEHLLQLGYRYINQDELQGYQYDIKQLGLTAAWEFKDNWALVGKHYYDFALKKPVDQFVGFQYNTCCWSISAGLNRYVVTRSDQKPNEVLYDHNIGFRFELRGFNNKHNPGIDRMLKNGKIPYIQPFSL